jgi:hypothetical protein
VDDFHAVSGLAEGLADIFGNHNGAMLATGAAEGNGEITLPFANVVRQEIDEEFGDPINEFLGLRERPNVLGYLRITASQGPEFRDEVRVREKAHIEHEVGVLGNTMFESETHA